jgi:hypothetical protein
LISTSENQQLNKNGSFYTAGMAIIISGDFLMVCPAPEGDPFLKDTFIKAK